MFTYHDIGHESIILHFVSYKVIKWILNQNKYYHKSRKNYISFKTEYIIIFVYELLAEYDHKMSIMLIHCTM